MCRLQARGDVSADAYLYKTHTPIISLRDISPEGDNNWCLVVCLSPSSVCDLFRAPDKWLACPESVFIFQIRRHAHVVKDGGGGGVDLFVADQVGTVHAAPHPPPRYSLLIREPERNGCFVSLQIWFNHFPPLNRRGRESPRGNLQSDSVLIAG